MPLSRILWVFILKYNTKSKALPHYCVLTVVNIQASVGNLEPILCKQLQHDYWLTTIYLPWKESKYGKHT